MNIDMYAVLRHLARACRLGAAGNYPFYAIRIAAPLGEYLRYRSAQRATEDARAKALAS